MSWGRLAKQAAHAHCHRTPVDVLTHAWSLLSAVEACSAPAVPLID
jgi:hypothetical protein